MTVASSASVQAAGDGDALRRALDYPYAWPGACFAFHGGRAHVVQEREALRQGRTPVLAYGSNRAPQQLARKFGSLPERRAILVERCEITGFDVVHSAHVTSYGAIPAALYPHAGVTAVVAVTWLDAEQLRAMDLSERAGRNYGRVPLGGTVTLGDGSTSSAVQAYHTSHGALHVDARIVSHADVEARGRPRPGLRNVEVLTRVHRVVAPSTPFEDFVLELVRDENFRDRVTDRLKAGL